MSKYARNQPRSAPTRRQVRCKSSPPLPQEHQAISRRRILDMERRTTKRRSYRWILLLALGMPALGQISETSLRSLYGKPVNGSYTVRPGVTIATSDGSKGQVCVLTIWGPATEPELNTIIDQAVPAASRGMALLSMTECAGVCQSIGDYERATVSSGATAQQSAHPAAIVVFKSKTCEDRVKEARAMGFSIRPRLP